ncbi:uncharacterized protein E0L32_006218 [Thyridium curvatum]|uniref:O-fucosyltransferase family protein n=1 Tax=Thyridium curvatum TaxID=1093900 RepID=A0A507B9N3_9PEZI|nr:uncharacterized protein E0L32_006218 [Thyridium curvatum]TPX13488.1 hypothetical protein E0L32_006218 [Thyridium curvatum]
MTSSRRTLTIAGLALVLLLCWSFRTMRMDPGLAPPKSGSGLARSSQKPLSTTTSSSSNSGSGLLPHVDNYFEQVFSAGRPRDYDYAALKDACDRAAWPAEQDEVYLKCGGMAAGLTSIISQVKVCLKMAVETGSNIVLPAMPLRDSTNLREFNFLNGEAYLTYDKWFDADHLREQLARACPRIKVVHPDELGRSVAVKHDWEVSCANAFGYRKIHSYFWAGRPFRTFFSGELTKLRQLNFLDPARDDAKAGITVVGIDSEFLLFRVTDDPTRRDLRLWNDLGHLVRFREEPRQIIDRLLRGMMRPFYGVHFRVENDTIWSSLDNQLKVDLDALDRAWELYGPPDKSPTQEKPLVYLACGDQQQVEKFVAAGAARGWEVTHKWRLADAETARMIDELAFDFQGAIDMGVMVRSEFFLGLTGSAFSSTVANQRDVTGRYRGSSFADPDDEGARTHLFNDQDADEYACCL